MMADLRTMAMKRWRNLALYYRNANKEMAAVIGGEQE